MLTFANLAGFWALLGIPAVLLIHFLQRQSQRVVASTLFLLEAIDRESVKGQKFERLRSSVPLWLQLLAVLILTWVLAEPRWMLEISVQKIVLVLDSSASMGAFKQDAIKTLAMKAPELGRGARTVEWTALESHLDDRPLYNGVSLQELLVALESWNPRRSAHDPGPALRVARSLAGDQGTLVFVTDHPAAQPGYGAKVLSVGSEIDNVGFAGVTAERGESGAVWQATLKNYSRQAQSREWFLQSGQQRTEPRRADLQPGEARTLQGRFPEGSEAVILKLQPDRFGLDDEAPIALPRAKELAVTKASVPELDKLMTMMMGSFENVNQAAPGVDADLSITTYNPLSPTAPDPVSIVLLRQVQPGSLFLSGPIAAARHPLMELLNWQGLIARSSPGMPVLENDAVLLWQGERPLIFLRKDEEKRQLVFNFDVPTSNLAQLPAFIVLANRFVEGIREDKVAPAAANMELGQSLFLACEAGERAPAMIFSSGGRRMPVEPNRMRSLRAPDSPGFFEVSQGEKVLLTAAAHFADAREADFTEAAPLDELAGAAGEAVTERTRGDDFWQAWLALLLLALLLSWHFIDRKKPGNETMGSGPAAA